MIRYSYMKKIVILLLLLMLIPLASLSYLGVLPGLSTTFVSARDLGIQADPALVTAFEAKYASPNTPTTDLDVTLSSTEVTSIFAVWQTRDPYFPLHDVQIRFNPDGSAEASGYLKIKTAVELAHNLGYSDVDISTAKDYIKYAGGDLVFYVQGSGGMTNNQLSLNPSTFQLGRVTVPDSITAPASQLVADMINRRLKQIGGADIQEAKIVGEGFRLKGTVPSTIKY